MSVAIYSGDYVARLDATGRVISVEKERPPRWPRATRFWLRFGRICVREGFTAAVADVVWRAVGRSAPPPLGRDPARALRTVCERQGHDWTPWQEIPGHGGIFSMCRACQATTEVTL